jgi:hypothetical protein
VNFIHSLYNKNTQVAKFPPFQADNSEPQGIYSFVFCLIDTGRYIPIDHVGIYVGHTNTLAAEQYIVQIYLNMYGNDI